MLRQEKLATLGRLSAGVAHEIGNPLAALLGYVELLKVLPEGATLDEHLGRMEGELLRIDRIVRDLLDTARPHRPSEMQPIDAVEVAQGALRLLRGQPRLQGVDFVLDAPPHAAAWGDAHGLQQLLLNLLLNAADAMAGRGEVRLVLRAGDDAIELCVQDSGPGLADDVLARLFDPFFTTTEPGEGTGLGLAIAWSLAESMGATLKARNRPEGGAAFCVALRPPAQAAIG
jgi:signal transduction histidine kinase